MIFILYTCLYFASSMGAFALAFLAYRSSRTLQNKYFALFTGFITGWLVLQFGAQAAHTNQQTATDILRFAIALTPWMAYTFLLFARQYAGATKRVSRLFLSVPLLVLFTSWSPLMIKSATISRYGIAINDAGPIYALVLLYAITMFAAGMFDIYREYRRHPKDHSLRARTRLLMYGFVQLLVVTIGGSIFLADNALSQLLLPISSFIMALLVTYAMIKHRLFDVRLVVERSFVYLLSLLTIGVAFTVISFSLTNLFLGGTVVINAPARWVYTVLALVLVFIFPPLKRFFDKVTNRIFFHDTYDPQSFLDQFNKNLVSANRLDTLLRKSARIIEDNLKPTYSAFVVERTPKGAKLSVATNDYPKALDEHSDQIFTSIAHFGHKIIQVDDLPRKDRGLSDIARASDVAIIIRLVASTDERDIGYLLLGPKKNGNYYDAQDLRILEIIANGVVIAVQNALRFEQIEHFNVTLQQRVDEATKKLRHANQKLHELDETKDDFISMASHQLRTPLTSVKGYISMLMEGDAGKINHMQQEMLGQAFFSSQRMVYLIADLLNVSRLKTGKFVIDATPVDLATVVEEELGQLEETAASRSLGLTYDKPKDFPLLMLDEVKIRQVIMNFVDNAIYYTPSGGHIDVQLTEKDGSIELLVTDDGIGVPKSEQPHLFTKFYRAGNARKARPDGTGLGLFMAKKVVVAQGGSIIFESKEDKGSTFGFIFSKHKLAVPGKAAPVTDEHAKAAVKT
jgi:signal transduction histidine kinase